MRDFYIINNTISLWIIYIIYYVYVIDHLKNLYVCDKKKGVGTRNYLIIPHQKSAFNRGLQYQSYFI